MKKYTEEELFPILLEFAVKLDRALQVANVNSKDRFGLWSAPAIHDKLFQLACEHYGDANGHAKQSIRLFVA